MRYKRKLIFLLALLVLCIVLQFLFPGSKALQYLYGDYLFQPYQALRHFLFGHLPFSIGDVLYFAGGLLLISLHLKWLYFLARFRSQKTYLAHSLLNTINTLAVLYLLFFLGWGGNYYKPSLARYWNLNSAATSSDSVLVHYDQFLIARLNTLAPHYEDAPFRTINRRAQDYYALYTSNHSSLRGLGAKPSLYGFFMQYLGIQGYYNPFTGEAQVNRFLPAYMLPFVICHEMAHQSGIGAEDDANLLSYALCVSSNDKDFTYSAYFNIWLYTHNRLRVADSSRAASLFATLNPISHGHVDTLRAIRRRYRTKVNEYSTAMYDEYLKLHNQVDGVDSYYGVVLSAWAWEEQRKFRTVLKLMIP